MFAGSIVALITPMAEGAVDIKSLCELVEFHIDAGTTAIVAAGTTGEAATLSGDEKLLVIKTVVDQAKDRVPVIAGTGSNATRDCISLTYQAMECGVNAVLIMTPAYIKPTQEGLYQHYSLVAQSVPIPIILYNVPSRTACDLLPETVQRLARISNIIGIKDATGSLVRLEALLAPSEVNLDIYSGDDETAASWMLVGAKGVISVTANIVPKLMAKLSSMALSGDRNAVIELQKKLAPLYKLLFVEANPIPVKWALSRMGLIVDEIRLPLTPLSERYQLDLLDAMRTLGLK